MFRFGYFAFLLGTAATLAPFSFGCTINNDCGGSAGSSSSSGSTGGSASGGAASTGGSSTGGSSTGGSELGPEGAFSFFVTSLRAMQEVSGSEDGFGGDLRFGETGDGAGLRGADAICTLIAEKSAPNNGKTWRAFLSVTRGEQGTRVDAIDRVGDGPWYDRVRRLIAKTKADLAQVRPLGADPAIINDLPNEDGVPNHTPDPAAGQVDNHDTLTGSNASGRLFSEDAGFTCNDWTSAVGETGTPRVGHSWTRLGPGGPTLMPGGATNTAVSNEGWMSTLNEAGCAPGAFIVEAGPPGANGTKTVGDGGGYGGIYCLALSP